MSSIKCQHCDTTEIDVDPSKGDATCTKCGAVLESSPIVAEVEFEESANGVNTAIGQFVSLESRGPRVFGTDNNELLRESREQTREKGREALNTYGKHLHLNQHCIDTSYNFFKLALSHNFTTGHVTNHIIGACLYLACRTEKADRLLIDCCDALEINFYQLGRMYLKLSKTLRINIPPVDPCLYIMRYSSKLGFGEHQHAVSMTALRIVQRMKKDWMHIGRRQTGICGAALLLAARMHNFSRTVDDIIKIVRVHECTLKKRLFEFGETPSSSLTFEEFMTIDLEEEQDPPCFKATKIKEQERLQKLIEDDNIPKFVTNLQVEIEKMLDKLKPISCKMFMPETSKSTLESTDASRFTEESVATVINEYLDLSTTANETRLESEGLGPNIDCLNLVDSLGCASQLDDTCSICSDISAEDDLNKGIDDADIDSYILTPWETNRKEQLWNRVNADYLQAQKEKEERKPEKRRKRSEIKNSKNLSANTAGEAINKMLKKKKISNWINYDVLKDVNVKDFQPLVVANPDESIDMGALQEFGDSSPLKQPGVLQQNLLGRARVEHNTATYLSSSNDLAETNETELGEAVGFEDDHRPMNPTMSLQQLLRLHNNSPEPDWDYSEDYVGEEY